MESKLFIATKAFIHHNEKVLILRESLSSNNKFDPGRYDVVGGRIAPGTSIYDSLLKEAKDQTGLDIVIGKPFYIEEMTPQNEKENWHIVCIYFDCQASNDNVLLDSEYDSFEWIEKEDFKRYYLYKELHNAFSNYINK